MTSHPVLLLSNIIYLFIYFYINRAPEVWFPSGTNRRCWSHLQISRDKRSGSGDIKERSVSAHIYPQTDLWWNFKEIIYISPPLNRCMKFLSTMKHTKKYILSQINQPQLLRSNWLWSTLSNSFRDAFMTRRLSLPWPADFFLLLLFPPAFKGGHVVGMVRKKIHFKG